MALAVSRTSLWIVIAAMAAVVAAGFALAGLSLDLSGSLAQIVMLAITIAVALLRWRWIDPRQQRIADTIELFGSFMLVSLLGALASYAIVACSVGYADPWLAAADRAMGFDWGRWYRFVAARPGLSRLSELAYLSIFASPFVVLTALASTDRAGRARVFVCTFALALTMTLVTFYFFPARSALAMHVGMHPAYMPATGLDHVGIIAQLRSGGLTRIDPGAIHGLVTFPSFHVAAAVLFVWAGWPIRWLRGPLTAINVAMIVSTPVQGTHYLVDVVGGVAVAGTALAIMRATVWRWPRLHAVRSTGDPAAT